MIIKFEPHGFVVFLTFAMGMAYAVLNSRSDWGFWKIAIVGLFVLPFLYYGFIIGRVVEVVAGSLIGLIYARGGLSLNPFSGLAGLADFVHSRRINRKNQKADEKTKREHAKQQRSQTNNDNKSDNKTGDKTNQGSSTHSRGSSQNSEEEVKRRQRQAYEKRDKQREQSESEKASQTQEPNGEYTSSSRKQSGGETKQDIGPLNPTNIVDAFKILGLEMKASLSECKQAYRTLISIYNSDKINRLSGHRKAQAEEEAKDINRAWATIKKWHNARK